jgi:hypothetical protein
LLESLYNPWPTELSFAWRQLGGKVIHGIDLLVEQALDAITLMTERDFDYSTMRKELLSSRIKPSQSTPEVGEPLYQIFVWLIFPMTIFR